MARVYRISTGRVNVTWEEALQLFLYRKKAQGLCAETLSDYRIHANRFLNAIQIAGKPNG